MKSFNKGKRVKRGCEYRRMEVNWGILSVGNLSSFRFAWPESPLLMNSGDLTFSDPGLCSASLPAQVLVSVFPGTGGVSAADSGLGGDRAPAPLAPAQGSPVSKAGHESPTPVTAQGAGAWPPAPPILASWESGWRHARLISKSSLARYLLGGSLGKRRKLGRNGAQAHSPTALWQLRFIALMEFGL